MKLNRKWLNEDFVDLSDISDKAFADDVYIVTTDKEYKAVTHR